MEATSPRRPWRTFSSSSITSVGSSSGSAPSSSSSSASNARLSLVLEKPASSDAGSRLYISAGQTLEGTVSCGSLKDAKTLKIFLKGKCGYTVMGRGQHQTAQTFGGAGAATVTVTYREIHTFLQEERLLWSEDRKEGIDDAGFRFSIDVPRLKTCTCAAATYTLPPSCNLRNATVDFSMPDRSSIEITYALSAVIERKGFLKRNTKAKIPLHLVDDSPPDYGRDEVEKSKVRGPLKYASAGGAIPQLECELSFASPTTQGGQIRYSLTYRLVNESEEPLVQNHNGWESPPPEAHQDSLDFPPLYETASNPLLAQIAPRVEVTLMRNCKTRPVERPRDGVQYRFPSYTITMGKNEAEDEEQPNIRGGIGTVRGAVQVPPHEATVHSCPAEIRHRMHAKVISKTLLGPIIVQAPVYLPSGV